MKKVLFIDKLDYLSLPLVLFFKLFFSTIVFRDTTSFFKKIKINKFFEKINIKWISYLNLDGKYYNSSFKYRFLLEEKFIELVINHPIGALIYDDIFIDIGVPEGYTKIKKLNFNE